MSRIVFANHLRKTVNVDDQSKKTFYTKPKTWAFLVLLNVGLISFVAMSWKLDNLWGLFLPPAKAYSIPSTVLAREPIQPEPIKARPTPVPTPVMSAQAQKTAQYIASTYHIAREASELIVHEAFKAGAENHVDPFLILAIIAVESHFNPIAESEVGALGLTQTMPEAHPEKIETIQKGQGHILNIADNIQLGTKVIAEYLRKFGNNSVLALQQYNGSLKDKSRVYSTKVLELKAKIVHATSV